MTPVIPCSVSNILLIPGTAFTARKKRCYTKSTLPGNFTKQSLSSERFFVTLPRVVSIFPQNKNGCVTRIQRISATGTDVAVGEQDSLASEEASGGASEAVQTNAKPSSKSDVNAAPGAQARRRQGRKSLMPPVKDEDLVPGAIFTGKVRSIQPFGAFVDIGAFTEGLLHVSRLSNSFVEDVNDVVSLLQEVKVKIVEVDYEAGRLSLSMADVDDKTKSQQKKDSVASSDESRSSRRNASKPAQRKQEAKKTTKFAKGQNLVATVTKLVRSGAFLSLPEDEEGFLPRSEEPDDGFGNVMGNSSLEVGQTVNVRILQISRGQVTLTMKKEEDVAKLDSWEEQEDDIIHTATNPFVIAFRRNKDIAAFLDEREKPEESPGSPAEAEAIEDIEKTTELTESVSETSEVQAEQEISEESDENTSDGSLSVENIAETNAGEDAPTETLTSNDAEESSAPDVSQNLDEAELKAEVIDSEVQTPTSVAKDSNSEESDENTSNGSLSVENVAQTNAGKDGSTETLTSNDAEESCPPVVSQNLAEAEVKAEVTDFEVQPWTPGAEGSNSEDFEPTGNIDEREEVTAASQADVPVEEETAEEMSAAPPADVGDTVNEASSVSHEALAETQAKNVNAEEEIPVEAPKEEAKVEPSTSGANGSVNSSGGSTESSSDGSLTKGAVSSALVKQLRDETGAGMMDCKRALAETGGDIVKAQEYLRKKGLASADKKASRVTAEGRIGSYVHDSRIGVLIEVNCETDFVSRGDIFRELVDDLAMQVAACPQVAYLSTDDVPKEIVDKETEIEMHKEDLLSRPEQIRLKIVEGRVKKRLANLALLEQPYIKNDKMTVSDWVKQTIATIGENIKVRRFVKYVLGEGLEKKSQDFAAEVAAQTAAQPAPAPAPQKEQHAEAEVEKPVEKAAAVAISAALVKQLREETGAGMMDCKKALAETDGDLEKAQEYLRKKGLSFADKKSSRIAAEGRIGSYIHDARIGVLIEVNCETDFVGRSEKFKELVEDLAMQVAACPQVQYVSIEDIPESIVNKEKEIEMQREDIQSKPESIREKIVQGRISKRLGQLALLEQPFIKNDSILVKDLVKQTVASLGENIKVRRFARFTLGEQTENSNT